uniref:Uncharacterized protein n=1 Tax=Oryza sativa subsp. japonica TaxID=39947 RepID=Q6YVG5_ORYSJ|nr:hypothetical protein [Oryza sativa Japonica Group]
MAIGVVVQAVGSATSSSSSCNMPHRQRRRIFLDYTSFFSGKCMLLRQFYPSTLFSCRRLSLLVSRSLHCLVFYYSQCSSAAVIARDCGIAPTSHQIRSPKSFEYI